MRNIKSKSVIRLTGYFLKGFAIGSIDVIPGISGGTVALMLGIYEKIINSVSDIEFGIKLVLLLVAVTDVIAWATPASPSPIPVRFIVWDPASSSIAAGSDMESITGAFCPYKKEPRKKMRQMEERTEG